MLKSKFISKRSEILKARSLEIEMHKLPMMDEPWFIIYDETNNFHKVYVRDGSFNIGEIGNFVVGGLVFPRGKVSIPIDDLRRRLKLQPGVKDIKLKHIGKGRFFDLLESERMQDYLDFLLEHSMVVHYSRIDPFYWAMVDIIDSILSNKKMAHMYKCHNNLKSDLHKCLSHNYTRSLSVLEKYGFPGIEVSSRRDFFDELIDLVDDNFDLIPEFGLDLLRQVLKYGRNCQKLPYLDRTEGDIQGMLMEKFGQFYRHRIILFKNSEHFLDNEEEVRAFLKSDSIMSEFPEIKYDFGVFN